MTNQFRLTPSVIPYQSGFPRSYLDVVYYLTFPLEVIYGNRSLRKREDTSEDKRKLRREHKTDIQLHTTTR